MGNLIASRTRFDTNPIATSHEIISPSNTRVSITFMPPSVGIVTLSNDANASLGQGPTLTPTTSQLDLLLWEDGDCVQKAWFATYAAANQPLGWIEGYE